MSPNMRMLIRFHVALGHAWTHGMRMILSQPSSQPPGASTPIAFAEHRELGCYKMHRRAKR